MSAIPIVYGDTLSEIAVRVGRTIEALCAANGIVDPDVIYAGDSLRLSGSGAANGPVGDSSPVGFRSDVRPTGDNAAAIAESFLGRNAGELKLSDDIRMEDWVPNNVNCANFVSGCLIGAGVIDPGQASASVDQLAGNLKGDGWQTVSLQDARPGDVVLMQRDGQSHVVLFAGFRNGEPQFIGSNNVNPDGSQQISWGGASGNYEIITPPR